MPWRSLMVLLLIELALAAAKPPWWRQADGPPSCVAADARTLLPLPQALGVCVGRRG